MAGKGIGKSIVLLIIIVILVLGGLLWFNFLGLIHVNSLFAPVYKLLGKEPQVSISATQSKPVTGDLDADRLAKQREALDIFKEELDKRETDIAEIEKQNEKVATELLEREKNQEEREKTFDQTVNKYNEKMVNVTQIAENLNGMRPENAVAILEALDDQTCIDVLRRVEEIAVESGSTSMGSYWLSLMPAERAAEIQRKMLSKPENLN